MDNITGEGQEVSPLRFRWMAAKFALRDLIRPRGKILQELGIKPGACALDFGCGPGGYLRALSELAGPQGTVYALDRSPLSEKMVLGLAARRQLANVKFIRSGCATGLADESLDLILLYDIVHYPCDWGGIFHELRRVLRPEGLLAVHDHHMRDEDLVKKVEQSGKFRLERKGKSFCFRRTADR